MIKGQRYPVTPNYLREAARQDWAHAGIDASFHDDATRGIRAAQHFLGHEDVKTTEIYLGASSEPEVRATIEARDDYVARMRVEASKGQRVTRLQ
jgi:hypothetical protein